MPPSAPILPDVACRTCWQRLYSDRLSASVMAWPHNDIGASLAPGPRMPSTRPIDHRWDRSRGIVFNNARRNPIKNLTWAPSRGIAFARPSAGIRDFASHGYAEAPSLAFSPDTNSLGDRNASTTRIGSATFVEDIEKVRAERDQFRQRAQELEAQLESLSSKTVSRESLVGRLESHIRQLSESLEQTRAADGQDRTGLGEAIAHITKEVVQLAQSCEDTVSGMSNAEQEAFVNLQQPNNVSNHHPNRKEYQSALETFSASAAEDPGTRLSSLLNQLYAALNDKRETLRRTDEEVQRLKLILEGERTAFEAELHDQRKSLDTERKHTAALKRELADRYERQELHRADYASYRIMIEDFTGTILPIVSRVSNLQSSTEKERRLWQAIASRFKKSNILPSSLIDYAPIARNIGIFLDGQADRCSEKLKIMNEIRRQLPVLLRSFNQYMHQSRMLTRYHHFKETWPSHETLGLDATLQLVQPVRQHVQNAIERAQRLGNAQSGSSSDSTGLQGRTGSWSDRRQLREERKRMLNLSFIMACIRDLQSLKTLLDDELAERWVYVKTHKSAARIDQAGSKLKEVSQHPAGKERSDLRTYRESARQARDSVAELISLARRECFLAQQLGQSDDQERQADQYIRERIELLEARFRSLTRSYIRYLSLETVSGQRGQLPKRVAGLTAASAAQETRVQGDEDDSMLTTANKSSAPPSKRLNISPTQANQASRCDMSPDLHSRASNLTWDDLKSSIALPKFTHASNKHVPTCMRRSSHVGNEDSEKFGNGTAEPLASFASSTPPTTAETQTTDPYEFILLSSNEHDSSDHGEHAMTPCSDDENSSSSKLTYHIPPKDLRDALKASSETSGAYWSHSLYQNPDGKFPVVYYCTSLDKAEARVKEFLHEKILGFDLEWEIVKKGSGSSGSIKSSVSLIQIAAEDKICLIHVARFSGDTAEDLLPPSLRQILESPDIIKTGVNVSGDATRVQRWLGVEMQGIFELSHLYRVVKYSEDDPDKVNFRLISLSDQVHEVLKLPLKKDSVRTSRWAQALNVTQTHYAAADAYAGFRLFHELDDERQTMDPMPPRPAFIELNQPLVLGDGTKVFKRQKVPTATKRLFREKAVQDEEEGEEFYDALENVDGSESSYADDKFASRFDIPTPSDSAVHLQGEISRDGKAAVAPEPSDPAGTTLRTPQSAYKGQRLNIPELQKADSWVSSWSNSQPPEYIVRAAHRHLRAYHLWHWQKFDLQAVASCCREPPLAISTVASYIMMAIKEENLPYDSERVREPLRNLPNSVHGMYQRIVDEINR